jgi:pimeloyl-ACP methyl ester carboxylesterase
MTVSNIHYHQASSGRNLAYRTQDGKGPGVFFLGGFRSDMSATKAQRLAQWCHGKGRAFVRFDYSGHGASGGKFEEGTIGSWLEDALAIFDSFAQGPQILVGSSMGGWIAQLLARARPERIHGLLTIACATDFTERLLWPILNDSMKTDLQDNGMIELPSAYEGSSYPITLRLLEDGKDHLLLDRPIPISCPVRMIHGLADRDVPWQISLETSHRIVSDDVHLTLIKNGGHRLSGEQELSVILGALGKLSNHPRQPEPGY